MKILKNPIVMVCLALLIICLIPASFVEAAGKVSEGSAIAGVSLEGLSLKDAKQELEMKVEEWRNGDPLIAISDYESVEIPRHLFQFDIDAALSELDQRMERHWTNFFKKQKNVQLPLEVSITNEAIDWPANVDIEKTMAKAVLIASNLDEGEISIKYIEDAVIEPSELAEITYSIPEGSMAAINYLVEEMDGLTIEAESAFSFLDRIHLPNGMDNSEIEMSFVASGLYALALQTNFDIIERHQQERETSYAKAGMEAEVDRAAEKNLLLYNPNAYTYTVHASIQNEQMNMSIHSFPDGVSYTAALENRREVEPRTVYRYNPELEIGEEQVIQQGEPGLQIEVYRNQNGADGGNVEQELISRDFYFPTPRIIEISTKEVTQEEEQTEESETPAEESTVAMPELNLDSLAKVMPAVSPECPADQAECEIEEPDMNEILLACIMGNNGASHPEDSEEEAAESNPYCDLIYVYFFLSLFGNQEIQEQTEEEKLLQNEEMPSEAVTEEEVQ